VFLDFRFVLMFCILAVSVRCICVLPLHGVIKNNNNNKDNNYKQSIAGENSTLCLPMSGISVVALSAVTSE